MARIEQAVFDAGPPIHLYEAGAISAFKVVIKKLVTQEVKDEIRGVNYKFLNVVTFQSKSKEFSIALAQSEGLGLGEASSIALCRQEGISFFFTDDLDAREVGKRIGLDVHGSIGLILRCLREGFIQSHIAQGMILNLSNKSSLYLSKSLAEFALQQIKLWERKNRKKI